MKARGSRSRFRRFREYWLEDEGLSAFLYLLFFALFIAPFTDLVVIKLLGSVFLSLVMVTGVANMSRNLGIRSLAVVLAGFAIVLRWLTHLTHDRTVLLLSSITSLIFMFMLLATVLNKVFLDHKPVTAHRIRGAVAAYLLIGITWANLYGVLDQTLPHAFNLSASKTLEDHQEEIVYFSFVTLATLGYGDIIPTHPGSRMFAVMEALVGQLYPATLLARLVSLELAHRMIDRPGPGKDKES